MSDMLTSLNGQTTRITGAGSVVISNHQGIFHRLIIPGTFIGTIAFYDSSTVAGTAAGNLLFSVGDPTHAVYPQVFPIGINYRNGLVYAAAGSLDVVLVSD